jgi:hypothetical protein
MKYKPVEVLMGILLVVLAILLVIAGSTWLMYRKRPGNARQRLRSSGSATSSRPGGIDKLESSELFWGVMLAQAGCESSQVLLGKHFTFDEAPELPLHGCSSATCTCQFQGLRERRDRTRRTHADRREVVRFDVDNPNRRSRVSRRRGDKWADHTY